MSIRIKQLLGFGLIFVLVFSVFSFQYVVSKKQLSAIEEIESKTLTSALLAENIKLSVVQVQQYLTDISLTKIRNGRDDGLQLAEKNAEKFHQDLDQFLQLNPNEKEKIDEIKASFSAYYEDGKAMAHVYMERGTAEGNKMMERFDGDSQKINEEIDQLKDLQLSKISSDVTAIKNSNRTLVNYLVTFSIVVFIAGGVISYVLSRSIINPLNRLIGSAKVIAKGDLSKPIPSGSNDEIGHLSAAFEEMRANLSKVIDRVKQDSETLMASAQELNAGAETSTQTTNQVVISIQEIAQGSDSQMKSISEMELAMDEMSKGIQQIAESAEMANHYSNINEEEAREGNQLIRAAIDQMNTIRSSVHDSSKTTQKLAEHSEKVGNIVEVIKAIAAQTNLLSLNASIEAARAGEHGKGFTVVAGEIRKLSEQVSSSTEKISQIIEWVQKDTSESVETMNRGMLEVDAGITTMDEAGRAFDRIMNATNQVSNQIQELSAASQQMSASTEQINASVAGLLAFSVQANAQCQSVVDSSKGQLDAMQNIFDSSKSLSQQAEELEVMTNRFKV